MAGRWFGCLHVQYPSHGFRYILNIRQDDRYCIVLILCRYIRFRLRGFKVPLDNLFWIPILFNTLKMCLTSDDILLGVDDNRSALVHNV